MNKRITAALAMIVDRARMFVPTNTPRMHEGNRALDTLGQLDLQAVARDRRRRRAARPQGVVTSHKEL